MNRPILIFYHAAMNYGDPDWGLKLIKEQLDTTVASGLVHHCSEFFIGLNGTSEQAAQLKTILPPTLVNRATILCNPPELWPSGEVGTMRMMAEWLQCVYPSYVLYFHTKGLSFPPGHGLHEHRRDWRLRMESVVLHRWRECIGHMENGADTVGQWWNVAFNGQYWAGNFFWAKSEFLLTLPYLDIKDHNEGGRYEAEVWIGRGPNLPKYVSL